MRRVGLCGLFWMLALVPRPAYPQTLQQEPASSANSRHQELLRRRLEKKEELLPSVPNRIERALLSFDRAETPTLQEANFHGFYPRVAWIARGSGISFGTRYWQRDIKGSPVDLAGAAFYSIYGYQHYDVQFGLMPHRGRKLPGPSWEGEELYQLADPETTGVSRFTLYGTFRHRYLPRTDFFGEGPDSELEDRSNYLLKSTGTYARAGFQFTNHFSVTLNTGYWIYSLGPGTESSNPPTQQIFDDVTAPGLSSAPDYFRFGANALIDYRDEPGNPHQGFVLAATAMRSEDQTEGEFSYRALSVDARGFFPLGSRQRILALRSAVVLQEPDRDNQVPFFVQPSLGGSHTLRGFDSYRFQGPKAMLYQLEYRWEASPIWELALFTDAGTVSDPGEELSFSELKWDYGFGMRFKNFQSVLIRIDVAWSKETTRFFLRTSSPF